MTKEEAIDVLKLNYPSACFTDLCEAVEIAIQALSAQPEPIKINIEDFNKEDWERLKKEWGNTPITVLSAQPEQHYDEWCTDCKEYDHERHSCPRWNKVIRETLKDAQPEIIRCKDCKWGREACGNIECFVDSNIPPEYHSYEWFCPNGERRTDE